MCSFVVEEMEPQKAQKRTKEKGNKKSRVRYFGG
jgi:hypothetical protein